MIAIKDMKMPKSCKDCPFNSSGRFITENFCTISWYSIKDESVRMSNCPLVEVK